MQFVKLVGKRFMCLFRKVCLESFTALTTDIALCGNAIVQKVPALCKCAETVSVFRMDTLNAEKRQYPCI